MLIALFALMMGQGVIWYTAQFYTQFFLEKIAKVDPATVNLLIMAVTAISAPLYMAFAIVSDRIGRKPVMLFGLGLAAISFFPGFMLLTKAVNPQLERRRAAKIPWWWSRPIPMIARSSSISSARRNS